MKRIFCAVGLIAFFLVACDSGVSSSGNEGSGEVFFSASGHYPEFLAAVGGDYLVFSDVVDDTAAVAWIDLHTGKARYISLQTVAEVDALSARADGRVAWIVDGKLVSMDIVHPSVSDDSSISYVRDTLATGILSPKGLAMDSNGVYWGDSTSVMGLAFSNGAPDVTSEPVTLASGVGALWRVAVSDGWLYFVEAYDRPGGKILRMELSGFSETLPSAEVFADSLGSPYDIGFTVDNVCWGEIYAPSAVWCKSKEGGFAWQVSPEFPIPMTVSTLASSGNTLFYRDSVYIARYSTDGNDTNGLVTEMSTTGQWSGNFVVADSMLYWREGSDINRVSISNTIKISSSVKASTRCQYSYNGSSSVYGGNYFGQFVYKMRKDESSAWTSRAISVNLTMSCIAKVDTATVLNVTWARIDDPYFGCQWGCTPLTGSVATLPEPPANPSSPSVAGEGIAILFPNGTTLATANAEGELTISSDGGTLSSSLNAGAVENSDIEYAWLAASTVSGVGYFPVSSGSTVNLVTYPSWILSKSAQ